MIFQSEHREQIRTGEKTMTRRRWDENRVTVGKTYRATRGGNGEQGMFTPRSECNCFICVTGVYRETLGEMDAADARARAAILSLSSVRHSEPSTASGTPEQVWVVAFEYAGDTDPEEP
jgi:hypothetical protein